jgi:hypothetical protein
MKQFLLIIFLILFLFQSFRSKQITETNKKYQWVSLFNGKDLEHWTPKIAGYKLGENFGNTFRVNNGILSTRYDSYDNFHNKFGALYYDKKFTNYRLKVEYRFVGDTVAGAPSWGFRDGGIQYDCQAPSTLGLDQPFPVCLEYNLLGSNEKEKRGTGEICASGMYVEINGKRNTSYCTPPTVKKSFDGDVWVTAEIDVHDGEVIHFVNGEEVIHFKNPRYDTANAIAKNFIVNNNDKVTGGYISLQSNSHPMDFRKIEIMEY